MSGDEEHRFVLLKKMTERKNGRLLDISVVPFFKNFSHRYAQISVSPRNVPEAK
jgi:hypothetical protein